MRKKVLVSLGVVIMLSLSACGSGVSQEDYESVSANATQLSQEIESLSSEATQLNQEITSLKEKGEAMESERNSLNSDYESLSAEYDAYKESMSIYEGLAVAEAQARQIEAEAMESSKAAEEAAAAAAAVAQKEAEEKMGYETGITFDQLARTPDDYKGKKVKFKGKVVQVLEGDGDVEIRLAVNSNYDSILYCAYKSSIVSSRVLEDDKITIFGTSNGLLSYQSTMGGTITIPSVLIDKIEQ